jgi:hypothetical protein
LRAKPAAPILPRVSEAPEALVARVIAHLRAHPEDYTEAPAPHPRAARLTLPGGASAPAELRAWAAFDRRYPWYLSSRRSHQEIADARGKLLVEPMKKVLRHVCLDSIRDEIEGDDETIAYLEELSENLALAHPGHGVVLAPSESPDRMLWIAPAAEPTVLWYENDAIAARKPFAQWLADLIFDA